MNSRRFIAMTPNPHCGKNRTLRDSIALPQLVFLPRAEIAGNAASGGFSRGPAPSRCWPAGPNLGLRWPSRLVATAEEERCAAGGSLRLILRLSPVLVQRSLHPLKVHPVCVRK